MNITEDTFFRWHYELSINQKMLSRSYAVNRSEIRGYIEEVLSVDMASVLRYVVNDIDIPLVTEDVFQFSSIDDVTNRICERLVDVGDPVLDAVALGQLLLNDGVERNHIAYRKYGENHGKMAARLGLLQMVERHYLLSCIGLVFHELQPNEQHRLLVRLIFRTPLIAHFYRASIREVNVRWELKELSDTTYVRRRSSICNILKILAQSDEYDFMPFLQRLKFI